MPFEIPLADLTLDDPFAIVVSRYNSQITDRLLQGAVEAFREANVPDEKVHVARVPGAWEIPIVAESLAVSGRYQAIVCLGAVIRGETSHDRHINRSLSHVLAAMAVRTKVPIQFGVLTCETLEQAVQRAGGRVGNKGRESAEAALTMARLMKSLSQ